MNYEIGDIVCSLCGRDKAQLYVVISNEKKKKESENRILIVNGKSRKIGNPKKKNPNHLKLIIKSEELQNEIKNNKLINDAYIRKILKQKEKEIINKE